MHKTKQQIRTEIASVRSGLDSHWLEAHSAKVLDNLLSLEAFQASQIVALYKAFGGEVICDPFFSECWKLGKRTCVPLFNSNLRIYEMVEIKEGTRFETGNFGIPEPVDAMPFPVEQIDFMTVPGVAFDKKGNRLGRGGGYYDRILQKFSGFSAAVAFDFQLLDEIPVEAHDIPVNAVVTEIKTIKVQNEH